jgi:hypothetical protein
VPDAENEVLVHVKDVASIDKAQARRLQGRGREAYPKAKLKRFSYTEGASKMFMLFDVEPTYSELEALLLKAGCEGKVDKGTGKLGEFPVELASSASAPRSRTTSTRQASGPAPSPTSSRPRRSAPRSATSSRTTASSRCSTRSASSSST